MLVRGGDDTAFRFGCGFGLWRFEEDADNGGQKIHHGEDPARKNDNSAMPSKVAEAVCKITDRSHNNQ